MHSELTFNKALYTRFVTEVGPASTACPYFSGLKYFDAYRIITAANVNLIQS